MWTLGRILGAPACALLAAMAAFPAFAQQPPVKAAPAEPLANFTMLQVEGGLMKLDTRTGKLSFCSVHAGDTWTCELVPEERSAYEDEIGRLNERIATLERGNVPPGVPDIARPPSTTPPPAATAPAPKAGEGSGDTAKKPDAGDSTGDDDVRSHMDRAMDMAEHVFRRFLDMVERLKDEGEKL